MSRSRQINQCVLRLTVTLKMSCSQFGKVPNDPFQEIFEVQIYLVNKRLASCPQC